MEFFTTADGLLGNNVTGVVQNNQGFIWFFNEFKLLRFDGRKFLEYPLPTGFLNPAEHMLNMSCYQDSLLFISTRKRILLLNPQSGHFESLTIPSINGKNYSIKIHLQLSPNNILVYGLEEGAPSEMTFWQFKDRQFEQVDVPWKMAPKDLPYFATKETDAEAYLLTPKGIYFPGSSKRQMVQLALQNDDALGYPWWAEFEKDGTLLALIDSYLYRLGKSENSLRPHPINRLLGSKRYPFKHFVTEKDGSLWVCGSHKSLVYYDAEVDAVFDFHKELETLIPYDCDFHAIMKDRSGVIWVATQMGLLKVVYQGKAFDTYFSELSDNNTYYSFRGLAEDEAGMIYGSYYSGGVKIDPDKRREYPNEFPLAILPFGLYAEGGKVFLNTGQVWDTQSKKLATIPGAISGEDGGVFTKDKDGTLWRTYHFSLFYLEKDADDLRWTEAVRLPGGNLWTADAIHYGQHSGQIWIGMGEQLLAWSPRLKKLEQYGPDEIGQSFVRIMSIHENEAGEIWLGTDNGLVFFNPKTKISHRYSKKDGLPNDNICGLLTEGDSCLWLSTNHGLSRFQIKEKSFLNFFKEDGLTDDEFNRVSYLKSRNGRMFFGGVKGVNAFFPNELMSNYRERNEEAHVLLTALERTNTRGDTLIREFNFSPSSEIHFYPKDRFFTFEYALTDFVNPKEIQYSYMMDGYEKIWSEPSKFNFTRFSSLPSGEYVFRVKARDSRGNWNPNQLAVKVVVHPPWWATWWAYILYAAMLISLVYFILRYVLNRNKLQYQLELEMLEATRLKELDQFKTRLYTNLTHEFRTPLTVILGMIAQIKDNPQKYLDQGARLIESNGKNLLQLINQLLDLSKLESRSFPLHLQNGDIVPYLRYVTESFQTFANSQNLSLRFFTPLDSLTMDYDAENMKQIMTNLISNAVKFTPSGGEVSVRLTEQDGYLNLEVKDTGIGISKENQHQIFDRFYQAETPLTADVGGTGIGLAHTKELVKLVGGQITVRSELGSGTSFLVSLPIRQEAPKTKETFEGMKAAESPVAIADNPQVFETEKSALPLLLVIEDNPDVVVYLKTCLDSLYEVDVAYNGQIGIDKAIERIPDLIISDVMMPEKDGFQVCDTLKNDERTSHIPIILLTAKADQDSKIAGLRRGADVYLSKPFDKQELLVRLEMLVERQKRMVAHFSQNLLNPTPAATQSEPAEDIQTEDAFMQKVRQIVEANYADEDFALPQLCQKIGMSRSQLFRKMQALSDTSPSDFIRMYRMEQAKSLLETGEWTVSEVAWKVGFKHLPHFSKNFQETFGYSPSATNK